MIEDQQQLCIERVHLRSKMIIDFTTELACADMSPTEAVHRACALADAVIAEIDKDAKKLRDMFNKDQDKFMKNMTEFMERVMRGEERL